MRIGRFDPCPKHQGPIAQLAEALDSESRSPGSNPGRVTMVVLKEKENYRCDFCSARFVHVGRKAEHYKSGRCQVLSRRGERKIMVDDYGYEIPVMSKMEWLLIKREFNSRNKTWLIAQRTKAIYI